MANLKTMLNQLVTQLGAQQWPGGTNPVFSTSSIFVSRFIPKTVMMTTRVPICQIMPGLIQTDPEYGEEPDLWRVQVTVRIIFCTPGDAVGQNPLLGANRGDVTKSEGAGVLDVEQQVYLAIGKLNIGNNANFAIQFRQRGGNGAVHVDDNVIWVYQDLDFEAWCTSN